MDGRWPEVPLVSPAILNRAKAAEPYRPVHLAHLKRLPKIHFSPLGRGQSNLISVQQLQFPLWSKNVNSTLFQPKIQFHQTGISSIWLTFNLHSMKLELELTQLRFNSTLINGIGVHFH
jgi:hypothetical protein